MFASLLLAENLVNPSEALLLAVAGSLGGIAPDLDLDTGKALGILASVLYLLTGFGVMLYMGGGFPVWQLWLAVALGLLAVKYAVLPMFKNWTRHRGIFHSLLAAVFFWLAATNTAAYAFKAPPLLAWLLGCCVFFGYVIHLLLDEIYAVDFLGRRLKKSRGTAFKLAAFNEPRGVRNSFIFLAMSVMAWSAAPNPGPFMNVMREVGSKTYAALSNLIKQV
jgi:membrane-bound metal-dependent hydrolase YbcI (DUF457 family)